MECLANAFFKVSNSDSYLLCYPLVGVICTSGKTELLNLAFCRWCAPTKTKGNRYGSYQLLAFSDVIARLCLRLASRGTCDFQCLAAALHC